MNESPMPAEDAEQPRREPANPERIYLAPACCTDPDLGRMWAKNSAPWPCTDCPCPDRAKPTEYHRIDAAQRFQRKVHNAARGWMRHAATQIIAAEAKAGAFDEATRQRMVAALFAVPRTEPKGDA